MSDTEAFKVWVGCLACYNDGRLVGEWFDASEAPEDMEAFDDALEIAPGHHQIDGHEELWCFDTENSPVSGEFSPMDAVRYAELIEDLSIPIDALVAYLENQHEALTEESVEAAAEAYIGDSDTDMAGYFAEIYDENELPEWARTHFWSIMERIAEDDRLGGGWYRAGDYYFRSY